MQTGLRQAFPTPDEPGHLDSGPALQLGPGSAQFSTIDMRDAIDEATDGGRAAPGPCVGLILERVRGLGSSVEAGTPVA